MYLVLNVTKIGTNPILGIPTPFCRVDLDLDQCFVFVFAEIRPEFWGRSKASIPPNESSRDRPSAVRPRFRLFIKNSINN